MLCQARFHQGKQKQLPAGIHDRAFSPCRDRAALRDGHTGTALVSWKKYPKKGEILTMACNAWINSGNWQRLSQRYLRAR